MAIEIEEAFEVDRPPGEVWAFLADPTRVVECLPGGELVERIDERTYRGRMGLELGPVGMTFDGRIRFDRLDEEAREVEMSGTGSSGSGEGGVAMRMSSRLEPLPDGGTEVSVRQTLELTGNLASFGRGGLLRGLADMMFGRFARCVEEKLSEG